MEGKFTVELFIIIWLLCAGLAAMLAPEGKKGLAALLGFLFGPIGVVIAAVALK